ncbi:hypothetical protein B0H10DRAFT_125137 [Mycena sp. CBHHK59/15]|nr:hypothetical protein B0H10DRAFT_125137 [Mycena sp. CBHHK59/15]
MWRIFRPRFDHSTTWENQRGRFIAEPLGLATPRGVRHPDGVTVPTDPSPHIRKVFGNSLCSTASIKFSSSLRPRHSGRVPRSLLNPESFLLTQNLVGRRDQPENKLLQSRASFQDMNRDRSVPPYRLQVPPACAPCTNIVWAPNHPARASEPWSCQRR